MKIMLLFPVGSSASWRWLSAGKISAERPCAAKRGPSSTSYNNWCWSSVKSHFPPPPVCPHVVAFSKSRAVPSWLKGSKPAESIREVVSRMRSAGQSLLSFLRRKKILVQGTINTPLQWSAPSRINAKDGIKKNFYWGHTCPLYNSSRYTKRQYLYQQGGKRLQLFFIVLRPHP